MMLQVNQLIKIKIFPNSKAIEITTEDDSYVLRTPFSTLLISDGSITIDFSIYSALTYLRASKISDELWKIDYVC